MLKKANLCSWAHWFESLLVPAPEDMFSHVVDHCDLVSQSKPAELQRLAVIHELYHVHVTS